MQKLSITRIEESEENTITYYNNDIIITRPKEDKEYISLTCPICEEVMIKNEDDIYFKKFKCCFLCGIEWVEVNREKWKTGWRPSKNEIKKSLKIRNSSSRSFSF